MIITKQIAENLIDKHHKFIPEKAKVILIHNEDGRVFFAEKFEQGVKFWDSETLHERTMQGIIHKLQIVAKRNDQGAWVALVDFSSKVEPKRPMTRQERMLATQESLKKARTTPAVKLAQELKAPAVQVQVASPVVSEIEYHKDFMSIRELESPFFFRGEQNLFLSVRSNGKIILNKHLRQALNGEGSRFSILISRDFKRLMIVKGGKEFTVNASGCYTSPALAAKVVFPDNAGTVRISVKWDDAMLAFIGNIK